MSTNKQENTIIATSALLTSVAIMHFLRVVFDLDLIINGVNIAMWVSYLAVIGTGFLAILDFETLRKSRIVWTKFIMSLFVIDAVIVFYSWISNLNYWGISHDGFGLILIFDIIVVILLLSRIKKN
ncbi:MAG: hypothetical protein NUV47_00330 [Patescibacteria group bacterium]|nr:hypothetical protein [Patescibacteria group bacterium]